MEVTVQAAKERSPLGDGQSELKNELLQVVGLEGEEVEGRLASKPDVLGLKGDSFMVVLSC